MKHPATTSALIAFIIWALLCLLFSQRNAAADGVDKLGWPLPFYLHYEGKMLHWVEPPGFIVINLLVDVGLVILLAGIIFSISKLVSKKL